MKFKEFLNKVEKEYFIDGEDYEELWEDESGYKQLLNEDNMSIPERLVLEKVRAKKKLKKEQEIRLKNGQGIKFKDLFKPKFKRRETENIECYLDR